MFSKGHIFIQQEKDKKTAFYLLVEINMSRRSKTGLMLVDNPKRFFKSVCILRNQMFTENEYQKVLGSLTKKGYVHEKTSHTYFYTATTFNLIEEITPKSHRYRVTSICNEICNVINEDIQTYRRYLKGLLLTNIYKGPLFRKFLEHTSTPKEVSEIENKFGKVPTKTLIAFCLEAGLAVKYGGLVKSIDVKPSVKIQDFYSSLVKVYKNLQDKSRSNALIIYASIDTIRDLVSLDLGLESYDRFDNLLEKTIDSQFGIHIYLHGAPPQEETKYRGFFNKNKRYAFISLRLNN